MMALRRWWLRWRRRVGGAWCGAVLATLLVLLACRRRLYEHVTEGRVRGTQPRILWDFLADFSNTKTLQPYLESFQILSESGNFDHWRYSVQYTEPLSTWPHLRTKALAHYSVRTRSDTHLVHSNHTTCFLAAPFLCLNTKCELETRGNAAGTFYRETVRYECPIILSYFCHRQVAHSRTNYFKHLHEHFE